MLSLYKCKVCFCSLGSVFRLILILFGATTNIIYIEAVCINEPTKDLIASYSCEGGNTEDLKFIPNSVEKIQISKMSVGRLSHSLLSRFADKLAVFSCTECEITNIDEDALHDLRKLQQLSLSNNKLTKVEGSWFQGLDVLTYLDLNYNKIKSIDGDVFRNAPELIDLRLSGNQLCCLDIEALSKLQGLKRIYVNENPNFGCHNALKKFLKDRLVEYEADSHWDSMVQDRIQTNEPQILITPHNPSLKYPLGSPPWPSTTVHPRRTNVFKEIPSSIPNSDFIFQTTHYSTGITRFHQLDNLVSTQHHITNETTQTDSVTKLHTPTTTDCLFNNASGANFVYATVVVLMPLLLHVQ